MSYPNELYTFVGQNNSLAKTAARLYVKVGLPTFNLQNTGIIFRGFLYNN